MLLHVYMCVYLCTATEMDRAPGGRGGSARDMGSVAACRGGASCFCV